MAGRWGKGLLLSLVLSIAAFCCVPVLASQGPSFSLNVDSLTLQKGVSSSMVVSMTNAQGAQLLDIEGLEHFDVLSQSQSTSTSYIQGGMFHQVDLYFTVMPKTAGQFTLKANVQYEGRSYESNMLTVTVREGSSNEGEAMADLFVKTNVSHSSAYLGEKVILTYELYTRYNIEGYGFTNFTAIDGMISKEMPENQLRAEYVYVDGVRYAKYEVKQQILDPIKAGVYTIPSYNLQVNVVTNDIRGGSFGGFGGIMGFSQPVYLQTEEKELTVKPLPTAGKPADFSGIVGELQLEGQFSREVMNYGDSFAIQVTAYGSCNLDGLKKVIAGDQPGFTVYETQKTTVESVENSRYRVSKAFEAIFVPEQNGVMTVEPISIPYFNPATEKYERAEIPGAAIEVLGDMPQPDSGGGVRATGVETIRIDQVSYTVADDGYISMQIKRQVFYGVLIGLFGLLALALVLSYIRASRKNKDLTLRSLYRQLTAAKGANDVYNRLNAIVKHCYGLSMKSSSQSSIRSGLSDADLADQIANIMDYMESAEKYGEKDDIVIKDQARKIYHKILLLQKSSTC
ncbi:MAG: BatD family protein [Peptococcaceae bacterium]|jgi:hypothetical protein|nr:BatD family protein [Peptococcaceae bacterium]